MVQSRLLTFIFIILMIQNCTAQSKDSKPKHHQGNRFVNLYPFREPGFTDLIKWSWESRNKEIPPAESYHFPLASNDPEFLKRNRTENTVTWIGHSTLLVQVNGINILTDPHFSERASLFQWTGPKRAVPPGIPLEDLPDLDLVLISHNHYDHLDRNSISRLKHRQAKNKPVYAVPLRLKKWFVDMGVENVVELDWWQTKDTGKYELTSVPMQHWSKRNLLGSNETLWTGWVIKVGDFKFFFLGDTGYVPLFKEIGERLGPFDLCAVPIGAYQPRWLMKNQHISPKESLLIHQDVRCKLSIGIHWGTFILTDEPLDEPPRAIADLKPKMGIAEKEFIVLQHGETMKILQRKNTHGAKKANSL